jgi:hypothetical protein
VAFDGFETFDTATAASRVHGRRGGNGRPILLLHGNLRLTSCGIQRAPDVFVNHMLDAWLCDSDAFPAWIRDGLVRV